MQSEYILHSYVQPVEKITLDCHSALFYGLTGLLMIFHYLVIPLLLLSKFLNRTVVDSDWRFDMSGSHP